MRLILLCILSTTIYLTSVANILTPKFVHYTNKEGLSSSYVKGIKQDKHGFIWVATRENITRFEGNRFFQFPCYDVLNNEIEIEPQSLYCLNDSLILVESMQNFFYYFDYTNECFKPYTPLFNNIKKESLTDISSNTAVFLQDSSLYSLNIKDKSISYSNIFNHKLHQSPTEKLVKLASNKNLVITYTSYNRILIYNLNTQVYSEIKTTDCEYDNVQFIKVDINNNIWLSVLSKGLYKLDYPSGKKKLLSTNTAHKLPHNMVHCVTIDRENRAWIGTENGLCIWNEYTDEFKCFRYNRSNPEGLNTNPIYNSLTDKDGNIWLGTYFGGINLWCDKPEKFTHWKTGTGKYHLGGKVVSCFVEDNEQNIWIGTEDMGVNKLNTSSGLIEKVTESLPGNNLSYENVHDILLVDKQLWIATYSGGINILNLNNKSIKYINASNEPELGSDYVYSLIQKDNIIYIGTDKGISTYNLHSNTFSRIESDLLVNQAFVSFAWKNNILWFCSYNALFSYDTQTKILHQHPKLSYNHSLGQVFVDSKNNIWIATHNKGLIQYDEIEQNIKYYNKKNGFPANRIFAIEEDNNNTIWVSTNLGLVSFIPKNESFVHYDSNSGIPFSQFNFRAGFKDSKGIIYFGGNEGMISINPEVVTTQKVSDVQFTELMLFNRHISPGNKKPIETSITNKPTIHLKHNQNVITINYACIDFTNKGLISYSYKLDGFDQKFNDVGNKNSATYTNLDPGKYTFIVKASNDAWITESTPKAIEIHIKSPFWLTPVAFLIYALIFLAAILLLNNISIKMQKSKATIELERQQRLHNEEINNFKLEFFTNISHEIKTPLSLILGPLSELIKNETMNSIVKDRLNRILINVNRLNNLLGELLEFRRIDKDSLNFSVNKCTDLNFIKNIEDAFRFIAEHREIHFETCFSNQIETAWLNKAVIEKIIFNLLSNSFKYCNSGNTVGLTITQNHSDMASEFIILVKDNGPGISSDELDKIQTRFYQSSNARKINNGAGIGLSYVNKLVKMHHGTISIESELEQGTAVTIVLPCDKNSYSVTEITEHSFENNKLSDSVLINTKESKEPDNLSKEVSLPTSTINKSILIVEDNIELLNFIEETLGEYNIHKATNGKEALKLIKEEKEYFDLIISDIMMPEMDGLQLTETLKSNIETSHLPIMLLTAKSGTENQFQGLKHGADHYFEKPFIPEILKQNIFNILRTRELSINKFSENIKIAPSELTTSVRDKEFIEELTQVIESNMDMPSLDVKFLTGKLHISRSLLHLKLKSLLNCSTTEYIRIIRLRKAIEFINEEKCSFSEAAYKTGFTSLTYFSRAFKNQYGKSPREYFKNS